MTVAPVLPAEVGDLVDRILALPPSVRGAAVAGAKAAVIRAEDAATDFAPDGRRPKPRPAPRR